MIQYSVGTGLNFLGLATTETKDQLATGQKTSNESLRTERTLKGNDHVTQISGAKTRKSIHVIDFWGERGISLLPGALPLTQLSSFVFSSLSVQRNHIVSDYLQPCHVLTQITFFHLS